MKLAGSPRTREGRERQTDRQTLRQTDRHSQTLDERDRQTDTQTDRHSQTLDERDRQTDTQTDRQTDTHRLTGDGERLIRSKTHGRIDQPAEDDGNTIVALGMSRIVFRFQTSS